MKIKSGAVPAAFMLLFVICISWSSDSRADDLENSGSVIDFSAKALRTADDIRSAALDSVKTSLKGAAVNIPSSVAAGAQGFEALGTVATVLSGGVAIANGGSALSEAAKAAGGWAGGTLVGTAVGPAVAACILSVVCDGVVALGVTVVAGAGLVAVGANYTSTLFGAAADALKNNNPTIAALDRAASEVLRTAPSAISDSTMEFLRSFGVTKNTGELTVVSEGDYGMTCIQGAPYWLGGCFDPNNPPETTFESAGSTGLAADRPKGNSGAGARNPCAGYTGGSPYMSIWCGY